MASNHFKRVFSGELSSVWKWNQQDAQRWISELPKRDDIIPKDRLPIIKQMTDRIELDSKETRVVYGSLQKDQSGKDKFTVKPTLIPYFDKTIPSCSMPDTLGLLMSYTASPLVASEPANEEELQGWLAAYCRITSLLAGSKGQTPFSAHIAYPTLPARDFVLSSTPFGTAVAISAGIATPNVTVKDAVQTERYGVLAGVFGDLSKLVREDETLKEIYGEGTEISLVGDAGQCFGHCAETLAWIMMHQRGLAKDMGGLTVKAKKVASLKDYDFEVCKSHRLPLCPNCRWLLAHVIKGNPLKFPP